MRKADKKQFELNKKSPCNSLIAWAVLFYILPPYFISMRVIVLQYDELFTHLQRYDEENTSQNKMRIFSRSLSNSLPPPEAKQMNDL